jgi:hypothetical protein
MKEDAMPIDDEIERHICLVGAAGGNTLLLEQVNRDR